ncbi:hypothetical protein HJFPF1_12414 [Paramyrothecium foliicola]|nr:hypothetical protein HJFPF1_12414 [Paramyrothecium foliicola]
MSKSATTMKKDKKRSNKHVPSFTSPYASTMVELCFKDQGPLRVPKEILRKSPVLLARYENSKWFGQKFDMKYSVGHVVVHFLFTGAYDRPNETNSDLDECLDSEISTALQIYHAAQSYELPLLAELVKDEISKLGAQLDLPRLIKAMEGEFAGVDPIDAWISAYLTAKIQSLTFESATSLANAAENNQSLNSIIFTGMLQLFYKNFKSSDTKLEVLAVPDDSHLCENAYTRLASNFPNSSNHSMGFVKDQMIEQMEEECENLELALDDIEAYGERYQCPGTHSNRKVCTKECFANSCFDWCLDHSHPSVKETDGTASVQVTTTTKDARGQLVTRTEIEERRICGHEGARDSPGDCVIITSSFKGIDDDEEGGGLETEGSGAALMQRKRICGESGKGLAQALTDDDLIGIGPGVEPLITCGRYATVSAGCFTLHFRYSSSSRPFARSTLRTRSPHICAIHLQTPRMVELHGYLFSPTNHTKRPRLCDPRTPNAQTPKKRKLHHPSVPPPQFWDNLSEPVLTKNALRELDRRNSKGNYQSRACAPNRRYHTRNISTTTGKTFPPTAQQVLSRIPPTGRAQLQRSARHGGPDLKDLRGHPPPTSLEMSSSQSSLGRRKRGSQSTLQSTATPDTTTTRSTGPYDRAFQQHLIDHHIFPPRYEYPNGDELPEPENLDDIRRVLEQPRHSLSPSRFTKEDFKKFERADAHATKESRVVATVIPIIEGDVGDPRCVASDVACSNLDHLTDGSLVCAKPDLYHGARPEQLKKEIRDELSNLIVPSTQDDLPILPNNFLEVKGPDGSLLVATRQATYNAALGSRAVHALQTYGAVDQAYDNNAYTLAWTYHGGTLKAYTNHPIPLSTPGMRPGYAMKQLKGWSLTSDIDTFRQGATAYRNGRDWAKSQRDQAIAKANNIVPDAITTNSQHESPAPEDCSENTSHITSNEPSLTSYPTSDTSEDELSLEFPPAKRSRSPEKQASDASSNQGEQDGTGRKILHVPKLGVFGRVQRRNARSGHISQR